MYSLKRPTFQSQLGEYCRGPVLAACGRLTQPVSALNPLAKDPSFGILPGQSLPGYHIDAV